MRRSAASVDNPLGYALVVEMGDLFTEVEVLHQRGAAWSGLQGVLVVGNLDALIPAHHLAGFDSVERKVGCLIGFPVEGFFIDGRGGLTGSASYGRPRAAA